MPVTRRREEPDKDIWISICINILRGIDMNILFFLKPKSTLAYLYNDNTLRQGVEKIRAHYYTAVPVLTRNGEYAGTVSEGDFLWHMIDNFSFEIKEQEEYRIEDIIRPDWNPPVKIDATMDDLLFRVQEQNFVPVVDDRNLFVGIITRKDIIKYYCDVEKNRKDALLSQKELVYGK